MTGAAMKASEVPLPWTTKKNMMRAARVVRHLTGGELTRKERKAAGVVRERPLGRAGGDLLRWMKRSSAR
jgi:hypothetical protein